jgi:hypothetical protein
MNNAHVHPIFAGILSGFAGAETNRFETQIEAEIAASHVAKANGNGYAFAVEWNDHWSVESRKPNFRGTKDGRTTKCVEVRSCGGRFYA